MPIRGNIIGKIKENTKIYRIFPRKRFLQLFQENRNALVLPTKWEDPFENVFLKADVVSATGEKGRFDFHDDVYGQCWTLEAASDAMWQIYSREKDSVRVRTTVGKLLASLCDLHTEWAHVSCFIGRVEYLTEAKLRTFGRTVFKTFPPSEAVARSLLVKRRAYRHENEVRIICIQPSDTKHLNGVYSYDLEPRNVIDQVMVDGRVAHSDFLPFKRQVMAVTGLSESRVKRSLLYRQPEGFLVEVDEIY